MRMSLIHNIFFCWILLGGTTSSLYLPSPRYGRCRGEAVNYLVSVPMSSLGDCRDACNNDERCCHYSYHNSDASHPDHDNCFIYSAMECDIENLMDSNPWSGWLTGDRTQYSSQCPRSEFYRWWYTRLQLSR